MANQTLILKSYIAALQVALITLLITSGFHFKDVKDRKDAMGLVNNRLLNVLTEEYSNKVNIKYGALSMIIILSTLKIPVVAAGLFLNHVFFLFFSFITDIIVAPLYLAQWAVFTYEYAEGSLLGILCSVASGVMTVIFIRFLQREIK